MFVRHKVRGRRTYSYLVESYRSGPGTPRTRTVCYLGEFRTAGHALLGLPRLIEKARHDADEARSRAADAYRAWNDSPGRAESREPPRPGEIASMGPRARKIASDYWSWKRHAEAGDRRGGELAARLDALHNALNSRSAGATPRPKAIELYFSDPEPATSDELKRGRYGRRV